MSILNKLKGEPVRLRLYGIVVLLAAYALAKGYVQASDLEFVSSLAALVLGVETSRAKVTPQSKRA